MKRIIILIIAIFTLNILHVNAQKAKYELTGQVMVHVESNYTIYRPVPGAVVSLISQSDSLHVITNEDGYFAFPVSPEYTNAEHQYNAYLCLLADTVSPDSDAEYTVPSPCGNLRDP